MIKNRIHSSQKEKMYPYILRSARRPIDRYDTMRVIIILRMGNLWNPSRSRSDDRFNPEKLHRGATSAGRILPLAASLFRPTKEGKKKKEKQQNRKRKRSKYQIDSPLSEDAIKLQDFWNISREGSRRRTRNFKDSFFPFFFHAFLSSSSTSSSLLPPPFFPISSIHL